MTLIDSAKRQTDWYNVAACGLVFFAFFMALLVSDRVFDRLPHLEDEVTYLFQAKTVAGGGLVVASPEPARAFWQPFVVDADGVRFGKYTPGWGVLLAAGVLMGAPFVINAFYGALSVALVYRLGRVIFNRDVGLIAAALLAFSPMALLLNATLMGHTSALFLLLLFMYGYWQITYGRRQYAWRWAIVAGVALGFLVANRPVTAVAAALPFVVWGAVRLGDSLRTDRTRFLPILRPLLLLSVFAIVIGSLVPLYSYFATGDPSENLYRRVWWYDAPGFGECCGRAADRQEGGHDLERGIRMLRYDLSLMAADLFGWQLQTVDDEMVHHWLNESDYYPALGLSWVLLPFGVWAAFRREVWRIALWLAIGAGLVWYALTARDGYGFMRAGDALFSYQWLAVAGVWLMLPLVVIAREDRRKVWAWLLISVVLALLLAQISYWIGSQRYSTRYLYEMVGALALLSALPLAWLARWRVWLRPLVYMGVALVCVYSLYMYSMPRISALHEFNGINRDILIGVEARRIDERPVLVLVTGERMRWRATASLMTVTSPYLDSDIVMAWDYGGARDALLAQFPDRRVIEMRVDQDHAWFIEE